MAEQERLLASDEQARLPASSSSGSSSSSSLFCCCRSGPLRYSDVGEAAEDAANALIQELSVQPTMWCPEAKDARVVDALQRIWMAIASENPHILRLAPPRIPSRDWRKIGFQGEDPYTDMRGAGLAGFTYIARLAEEYAEARMIGASGEQGEMPFGIGALNVLWMLRCHLQLFAPNEAPPAFCPCCGAAGVAQEYGPRQPHRGRHIRGFAMLLLDDRDAWMHVFALSFLVTAALWRKRGETMTLNGDVLNLAAASSKHQKRGSATSAAVSDINNNGGSAASGSVRSSLTGASGPGGVMILAAAATGDSSANSGSRKDRAGSRRRSSSKQQQQQPRRPSDALEAALAGGASADGATAGGGAVRGRPASGSVPTETASGGGEVRSASGSISQASGGLAAGGLTVVQRSASSASTSNFASTATATEAASASPSTHDAASSVHHLHHHHKTAANGVAVGDLRLLQFNSILHEAREVIMEALSTFPPDLTALRATLFRKLKAKGLASSASSSASTGPGGVPSSSSSAGGGPAAANAPYYHQASYPYGHHHSHHGHHQVAPGGEMLPVGAGYHELSGDNEGLAVPQSVPVPTKQQQQQQRHSKTAHNNSSHNNTNSTLKAASVRPVAPMRGGAGPVGAGGAAGAEDEHLLYLSSDSPGGLHALSSSYAATTPPFGTSPGFIAGSWQAQAGHFPGGGHSLPYGVSTAAKWGSRAGGLHAPSDLDLNLGGWKDGVVTLDETPGHTGIAGVGAAGVGAAGGPSGLRRGMAASAAAAAAATTPAGATPNMSGAGYEIEG